MKVLINKIPDEGIKIQGYEDAESLNILPSELILKDAIRIDATVSRDGEVFFVDGTIKTVLQLTCSRCATEFSYPINTSFHCHEEPVGSASVSEDLALKKQDMEIDYYSGEEVEINDLFREQVMLAVPMNPLCKQNCLGLCPKCGQNLNIIQCDCTREEQESPFSVIKKLFD